MPRARNIKPGFFRNEELVELDFEYRLLFIGLWTLADREGRLEDRPKRIRMEVFPADDVDIEHGLDCLEERELLQRYTVNGRRYIQITAFVKHQNPHHKESPSEIPPPPTKRARGKHDPSTAQASPPDPGQAPDSGPMHGGANPGVPPDSGGVEGSDGEGGPGADPGKALGESGADPADSLIPDSLIPESLNPDPCDAVADAQPLALTSPESEPEGDPCLTLDDLFDEFWSQYPRKDGKQAARKAFEKLKPSRELTDSLLADIAKRLGCGAWDPDGSDKQFIPHPSTYLNQERWNDEIIPRSSHGNNQPGRLSLVEQQYAELDKLNSGS